MSGHQPGRHPHLHRSRHAQQTKYSHRARRCTSETLSSTTFQETSATTVCLHYTPCKLLYEQHTCIHACGLADILEDYSSRVDPFYRTPDIPKAFRVYPQIYPRGVQVFASIVAGLNHTSCAPRTRLLQMFAGIFLVSRDLKERPVIPIYMTQLWGMDLVTKISSGN